MLGQSCGWALANHMRTELVSAALQQALGSRDLAPDHIFHSDRGSQYGIGAYRRLLNQAGLRQSISARATPYHNAWTESLIDTLKNEMLKDGCFLNEGDARTEIYDYINSSYYVHHQHSAISYQTPMLFEVELHVKANETRSLAKP